VVVVVTMTPEEFRKERGQLVRSTYNYKEKLIWAFER
jgi:hypothetical protein